MSSTFVRDTISTFITTTFPLEKLVDVTAEPTDLEEFLTENNISMANLEPWLATQFIGADEIPVSIQATNNIGTQRETGAFAIHAVEKSSLGVVNRIQPRLEALRNAFRNRNISGILILSAAPPNYGTGATLDLDGGYTSGTILLSYEYTFSL